MTDAEIEALAKARGLERAWRDHPADVREAVIQAARIGAAFTRPADPAAEPMPAHAVRQS
ncbi:hypothetical protein GXW71_31840 [Roseomonas hellenica]|uniref:Uncharacterized protein n=1 Tax=Plastoroseomonas hellenica TaxID=2687306 RepID=A0ABS5F8U4_9PROT|nr:hypothetical protein [Plastoroseomonas hellenica]MBR0668984.1 hypothetical protein [Plastoroseomonas hellenica]